MSLIPIDEVCHFDVTTHLADTGAVSDADSAPTFDVFEEATDTPILDDQTMTKRTSLTGNYRGAFTVSAANGFEAGKWYIVVVSATVDSISAKHVAMHFRAGPAETLAGVPKGDVHAVSGDATAADTLELFAEALDQVDGQIDAGTLAADVLTAIADALLDRDMSTGTDSGSPTVRTVRQALRILRNKWDVAAGTLTVKKEDDTTTSWTSAVTADAAAEPIIGHDPASS